MLDQLARLNEEQLVFLGLMSGMVLFAVTVLVSVVAVQIRKIRQREMELGFKDDLLHRGYTVDETIQLMTSHKPGWSQGLIDIGDWIDGKLRPAARRMHDVFQSASVNGGRRVGDLWQRASPQIKQFSARTAPWVHSAVSHVNCGVHWLGQQTEALVRRLATPRS